MLRPTSFVVLGTECFEKPFGVGLASEIDNLPNQSAYVVNK